MWKWRKLGKTQKDRWRRSWNKLGNTQKDRWRRSWGKAGHNIVNKPPRAELGASWAKAMKRLGKAGKTHLPGRPRSVELHQALS